MCYLSRPEFIHFVPSVRCPNIFFFSCSTLGVLLLLISTTHSNASIRLPCGLTLQKQNKLKTKVSSEQETVLCLSKQGNILPLSNFLLFIMALVSPKSMVEVRDLRVRSTLAPWPSRHTVASITWISASARLKTVGPDIKTASTSRVITSWYQNTIKTHAYQWWTCYLM